MPEARSIPASKVSTMCSLSMPDATRASARKRLRSSSLPSTEGSMTFSARRRFVSR
jgi:hypothetical protein